MTFLRRAGQSESPGSAGRSRRTRRLLKLGLLVLALGAIVSISLRVAAPYLISSSVVRSAIESAMAQWAGHPVSIEDVSELRFWPRPEVTIEGVTIRRDDLPFVEIESLTAEFSLLSAVKGQPDFNDFRFERPRIRIERDIDGRLDWSGDGLLNAAVRSAQTGQADEPLQGEAEEPEIGSIEVVDGEVTLIDAKSGSTIVADGMNAKIDWPRLTAALSGQATFTVAERRMSLTLATPTPLLLLGGAPAADLVDAQIGMRAVAQADRSRGAGDLLLRDDMLEIAEAEPSILLFHGDAVKTQCAHFGPQLLGKPVFRIDASGEGRDAVCREAGGGVADGVGHLAEREVEFCHSCLSEAISHPCK